jgi:hypothetical protein
LVCIANTGWPTIGWMRRMPEIIPSSRTIIMVKANLTLR